LLNAAIRVNLNLAVRRPTVTDWQVALKLSTPRLLSHGFQGSLAEQVKLEFTHGSLETEQQPIIDKAWVVHSFWVDYQGPY